MSDKLFPGTVTITFGDCVENHVGMQKLHSKGPEKEIGFTNSELSELCNQIADSELYQLKYKSEEASILVIRNALDIFGLTTDQLISEHSGIIEQYDKRFFNNRRGEVSNKIARYNACFADFHQPSNPEEKKGIVFSFTDEVPLLGHIRNHLGKIFGQKAQGLLAEGNYYYDTSKCGIGWHGDTERVIIIGLRLGEPMPLKFRWYHETKPVGKSVPITLYSGDMYIMSEKASGNDWKKQKIPTLRHSAGCEIFSGDVECKTTPKKKVIEHSQVNSESSEKKAIEHSQVNSESSTTPEKVKIKRRTPAKK